MRCELFAPCVSSHLRLTVLVRARAQDSTKQRFAVGVFDGHGREMGRLAALTASSSMKAQFDSPSTWAEIERDPNAAFVRIFNEAHAAVKEVRHPSQAVAVAQRVCVCARARHVCDACV